MAIDFDKNLLLHFDIIKDNSETILWIEKPKYIPFILTGIWSELFIIVFGVTFLSVIATTKSEHDGLGIFFSVLIGLFFIIFSIWNFISRLLSYRNTCYACSDKRIMIRTGIVAPNFKVIDYDKIIDLQVTVNLIERKYQVGTVRFFSGKTEKDEGNIVKVFDEWQAIPNCYDVFRMLKQIIVDVKTDYTYPNDLRPETNPGYNTKYNRN